MSECEKHGNSCGTGTENAGECKSGMSPACCPVEKAAEKWSASFCQALTEVQVDILKQKIQKAWGAQMDKVGDAVLESLGAQWQAMIAQAKAHLDLRESIKKSFAGK